MWLKWFPWRFIVRKVARQQGFLDPISILSKFQDFAQPSDVLAPRELMREGVVLHARGLMNSQAIQHNLDWVWPYWIECQYNPQDKAFVPRAFSLTQINLTHRNWTALGLPDSGEYPIVDPRGLVTPLYDGWSIDAWIIPDSGQPLIPSRLAEVSQKLTLKDNLNVVTESSLEQMKLHSTVQVIGTAALPLCQVQVKAHSARNAWLIISLRPYNPEGVSFIHNIAVLDDRKGWRVNDKNIIYLDTTADQFEFSYYRHGDVFNRLPSREDKTETFCKVGMASAAALYRLEDGKPRNVTVSVPLLHQKIDIENFAKDQRAAQLSWKENLPAECELKVPDDHFQYLYEAAIRTMILHCPDDVYAGPYTYRRFWFRDAAFILHAMLCVGLEGRAKRAIDRFMARQQHSGYFISQEGEWDSNGEALWIFQRYCELTNKAPDPSWLRAADKGGIWISRKRLAENPPSAHAGLLPPGFSAEHLGPNDYYYWDDFWGIAGLNAVNYLQKKFGNKKRAVHFEKEAQELAQSVERSLALVKKRMGKDIMPASPYRRMDAGAIGSLAAGYPLQLFSPGDPRLLGTVGYLIENCLHDGGFFHDMTHSGVNPYLTLHMAQVLLRSGDPRYFDLMATVAKRASPTGQWPEAIHPATGGGCMGDGQHVWAASEWVMMVRNCFMREENEQLIFCSGVPRHWLKNGTELVFGPAATSFGKIRLSIKTEKDEVTVSWKAQWYGVPAVIKVCLPGIPTVAIDNGETSICLKCKEADNAYSHDV